MTQSEVNKIITERVLRECWHEWTGTYSYRPRQCAKCKIFETYSGSDNSNFSHWGHYGPLLEKIQGERYWEVISYYTHRGSGYGEGDYEKFNEDLLSPSAGSYLLAEFIVEHPEIFGEVYDG